MELNGRSLNRAQFQTGESLVGRGRIAYPPSSFSFVNSRFVTVLHVFVTFDHISMPGVDTYGAPLDYTQVIRCGPLTTHESKLKIYFCPLTKDNRQESAYRILQKTLGYAAKNTKKNP